MKESQRSESDEHHSGSHEVVANLAFTVAEYKPELAEPKMEIGKLGRDKLTLLTILWDFS